MVQQVFRRGVHQVRGARSAGHPGRPLHHVADPKAPEALRQVDMAEVDSLEKEEPEENEGRAEPSTLEESNQAQGDHEQGQGTPQPNPHAVQVLQVVAPAHAEGPEKATAVQRRSRNEVKGEQGEIDVTQGGGQGGEDARGGEGEGPAEGPGGPQEPHAEQEVNGQSRAGDVKVRGVVPQFLLHLEGTSRRQEGHRAHGKVARVRHSDLSRRAEHHAPAEEQDAERGRAPRQGAFFQGQTVLKELPEGDKREQRRQEAARLDADPDITEMAHPEARADGQPRMGDGRAGEGMYALPHSGSDRVEGVSRRRRHRYGPFVTEQQLAGSFPASARAMPRGDAVPPLPPSAVRAGQSRPCVSEPFACRAFPTPRM